MAKGVTIPIVYKADLAGLDKANKAIVGFQNNLGFVEKALRVGIAGASAVAGAAIAGVGFAVTKGFGRLQQIENAEFMLKGLGHTAEGIEGIMDSALASVKGTAFGLGDAANIAAQAVAAGVQPGEELTRVLKVMADTAAITGQPLSDIQSIMGKVITNTKASRTELQQLADRGIPIYQMLADTIGTTADKVMEMASDGEISADILVDALENKIGGAALKMGDSTEGAFANTLAAISRVGANLIGPIYDQFGEFFRAAIEGLEPIEESAKGVGEAIGKFLNPRLDTLVDAVRNLSPFFATLSVTFGELRDRAGGLAEFFQPLVDAFLEMLPALSGLQPLVERVAEILGPVLAEGLEIALTVLTQLMSSAIPQLVSGLQDVLPPLLNLAETAIDMLAPILGTLATSAVPILTGVLQVLTPVLKVVALMAESLDGFLVILVGTIFAGVRAFAAYKAIMLVVAGVQAGVAAASYGAAGATYALTGAQKFGLVMSKLLSGQYLLQLGQLVSLGVAWVASKAALIGQTAATIKATLAQRGLNLSMLMNPIGLVVAAVALLVAGLVLFFTKTEIGRKIWEGFVQGAIDLATGLADWFIETFTVKVPEAWAQFTTSISEIWSETGAKLQEGFAALGEFFKGIINGMISVFEGYINSLIRGINWVIGKINQFKVEVPNYDIFGDLAGKTFGFNFPEIPELSIPRLAEGGIVDRATLAMIGEAGPEAVVPLDKGRMGATYNITVNAGMGAEGGRIGEAIIREIKRYERQSGPVFASA